MENLELLGIKPGKLKLCKKCNPNLAAESLITYKLLKFKDGIEACLTRCSCGNEIRLVLVIKNGILEKAYFG